MESFALFAALAAALVWAVASIIAHGPVRYFGVFRFVELQLPAITLVMVLVVFGVGGWETIQWQADWLIYTLSALVGILLGDLAFHKCLSSGGPRRSQLLFTLNAPMAAMLGYYYFGEILSLRDVFGVALMLGGLVAAVTLNSDTSQEPSMEQVDGQLSHVILWGGLAAICQASGLIMMKPVLVAGADPIAITAIRTGICAIAVLIIGRMIRRRRHKVAFHWGMFGRTCISGILGYALAMGLLLFALRSANVGLVSTLAAMTPVIMLPLLWAITKQAPKPASWFGAVAVVIGVGLLSY